MNQVSLLCNSGKCHFRCQ